MPKPTLTAVLPLTQEKPMLAFQRHSGGSGAQPQWAGELRQATQAGAQS
jgi:hypothetical protein